MGNIVALTTHARAVPAAQREMFAAASRARLGAHAFLVETCHRVEAYLHTGSDPAPLHEVLPDGGHLLAGEAAVRHAISIAAGLDSVVVGEDQILHQLREAISSRRGDGSFDPVLERLFTLALRSGRRARSWRQGPAPSLADRAVELIERASGPLRGRKVLVVGTGQIGRLAVQAAMRAEADVSISSRTPGRAASVARRLNLRTVPFDGRGIGADLSTAIVALRGRWPLNPETADSLAMARSIIADLSVPPALDPALIARLGARYVSADDLAQAAPDELTDAGRTELARITELVDETAAEFLTWLEAHQQRAAARALTELAETERAAEMSALWRRLPLLDPETRREIEGMSRHLAVRLLREPLERLGRDPDGRHERAARELFGL